MQHEVISLSEACGGVRQPLQYLTNIGEPTRCVRPFDPLPHHHHWETQYISGGIVISLSTSATWQTSWAGAGAMTGKGGHVENMTVDQQGTPAPKRKVPDAENMALSIDVIREAITGELKEAMSDFKQELWGFGRRIDKVENQVTKQMQQTVNFLDEMTGKHAAHGDVLQQLQEASREVNARLERLEKGGGGSSTAGSTVAPTEHSRRPALVIGGWNPDQEASATKEAAMDILRSVEAPINLDAIFV